MSLKFDIKHKNKLASILRQYEKEHYSNLLEESKQNIKETWKFINKVLNKQSKKIHLIHLNLRTMGQLFQGIRILQNISTSSLLT